MAYQLLDWLQRPFGFVFWLIEQKKARIQDRNDNDGGAQ
jgi:type IV secretory pathway TrbD component